MLPGERVSQETIWYKSKYCYSQLNLTVLFSSYICLICVFLKVSLAIDSWVICVIMSVFIQDEGTTSERQSDPGGLPGSVIDCDRARIKSFLDETLYIEFHVVSHVF